MIKQLIKKLLVNAGYTVVRTDQYLASQLPLAEPAKHSPDSGHSAPPASDATANTPANNSELYTPVFNYDGLMTDPRVIHNHDFMRDPRYVRSYRLGEAALGHDHKMFWRLHVALWCASQAAKLPGDFVECGVWRGFLSTAIIEYVNWADLGKTFYLFDTYKGLDERYLTDVERANTQKLEHFNKFYVDCYDFVKGHFAQYPRVEVIRGAVPDTLTQVQIDKVSFLSIDMNCAPPEIAAANYFWDKLVPGALVLLDDYGFVSYEEQKIAFDRFAKEKGIEILALPSGQGLIIK